MFNGSLEVGWLPCSQRHPNVKPILKKMDSIKPKSRTSGWYPTWHLHQSWWSNGSVCSWRNFWSRITFFRSFSPDSENVTRLKQRYSKWCQTLLAADQGQCDTSGILFDMSAAFDAVDHEILLICLRTFFGVDGTVLSWLELFLRDQTQQVAFSGQSSALNEGHLWCSARIHFRAICSYSCIRLTFYR